MRAARRSALAAACVVVLTAPVAGCTVRADGADDDAPPRVSLPPPPVAPDADPAILPTRQVAEPPVMRLAPGLPPPTNRWFTSLALGDTPRPVFPRPLAVALTESGFGVGVPPLTTTATGVMGPYTPQLTVDVGGTGEPVVSAYDAASVTVDLGPGDLTIVEGSPVLHWTAGQSSTVTWDASFDLGAPGAPDDAAVTRTGERTYLLLATDPDQQPVAPALAADGRSAQVPAGGTLAWLALPDGVAADSPAAHTLAQAAAHPPAPTVLRWRADADTATTVLDLGAPTVVVRLPHQSQPVAPDDLDCDRLGTYETVLGEAVACTGRTAAWASPVVDAPAALDLTALSDADLAVLVDAVEHDVQRLTADDAPAYPADTYFGGKALARDAHLLHLATALDLAEPAARLRDRLGAELRLRTEPDGCAERAERCFVLDPVLATVVGLPAAFGSEEGNDHHFHYGYLLQAAALASLDDAEHGDGRLAADLAPVVDVLAADIAAAAPLTAGSGPDLPALRVFDAFAGHSWASGTAPFADGNNQESSSEAVAAWYGLDLWARARGDQALSDQARWLLAAEAASARAYWLEPSTGPVSFTSLVWGGKREQATWFSAEPTAALGIEVLPVTPASGYLSATADGGERIRANLAQALHVDPGALWDDPDRWDVQFGDQLLAYAALAGPDDAAHAVGLLRARPDDGFDDGATRAWLLAWAMTRAA